MEVNGSDISLARVIEENNDTLIIEVAKHDKVKLNSGHTFLALLFIRTPVTEDDVMETWKPWEG